MAWTVASLEFPGNGCPAAAHVPPGDELECLLPQTAPEPVGWLDSDPGRPWETVTHRGGHVLARIPGESCEGCPILRIDDDVLVLRAQVCDGRIRSQVALESVERLARLVSTASKAGLRVRLRRLRNGGGVHSQAVRVNLDHLTPRQRTVLRQAHKLGYFEPAGGVTLGDVADALGLGRSTVHEHLQKGLRAILDECMRP